MWLGFDRLSPPPRQLSPQLRQAHSIVEGGSCARNWRSASARSAWACRSARSSSSISACSLSSSAFGLSRVDRLLLGIPSLGLEPLGLTPLDLQPMRFESLLTPTLPLKSLRLLSGGLSLGFETFGLCGLGAFGRKLLGGGAFGCNPFSRLVLGIDPACSIRSCSSRRACGRATLSQTASFRDRSASSADGLMILVGSTECVVAAYEAVAGTVSSDQLGSATHHSAGEILDRRPDRQGMAAASAATASAPSTRPAVERSEARSDSADASWACAGSPSRR